MSKSKEEKDTQNQNLKGSDTDVVWPESEEELNAIPPHVKQKMLARQIEQKRMAREKRSRGYAPSTPSPNPIQRNIIDPGFAAPVIRDLEPLEEDEEEQEEE